MEEELKPCPVCNGDVRIEFECDHYYISCKNFGCGAICIDSDDNDDCISQWNALPRRLRWTKEKPTQEGWYWLKEEGRHAVVKMTAGGMISEPYVRHVNEVDGEWAGPIPEPISEDE